tara:strand:- start:727 stop:870 length:144 start_codon:yes stop_codon:yes gene_type:complete
MRERGSSFKRMQENTVIVLLDNLKIRMADKSIQPPANGGRKTGSGGY